MSRRYPHTLIVYVPVEGTRDASGNWSISEEPSATTFECRDEPNTRGGLIQLTDGSTFKYSSTIYLPAGTPMIPSGVKVTATDANGVRMVGVVKRFSTDGNHCRLWV